MEWCCWSRTGQNNPPRGRHSPNQTPRSLCWSKNSVERHLALRSSRHRKDFPRKGMCHLNERRNLFQHFCLRFNVKVCRLIIKNTQSPFSISQKIKTQHHFYRRNRLNRWRKIVRRKRSVEKSKNWVPDSDAGSRKRLQRCVGFGSYESSMGFGFSCAS